MLSIWVPTSYLSPTKALRVFTVASKLQFHIFDPRGQNRPNIKILPVNQSSDLGSKLNHTHQHGSMDMLGFQNRAIDIKLLNFHANRDNSAYLENHNF